MTAVEFSDEYFGFKVPDYTPSPGGSNGHLDVVDGISMVAISTPDCNPKTNGCGMSGHPVEHSMSVEPTHVREDNDIANTEDAISDTEEASDDIANTEDVICDTEETSDNIANTEGVICDTEETSDDIASTEGVICDTEETSDDIANTEGIISGRDEERDDIEDTGDVIDDNEESEELCLEEENEDDITEIKSRIEFQQTTSYSEDSGFSLLSGQYGHKINIHDTDNSHVVHMKLQSGDSLIAIKDTDIRHYEHHILTETLQHLYGEESGVFTLVIGREFESEDGKMVTRFLEIRVQFEFPTRGNSILKMTVRVNYGVSTIFTKILSVKFKASSLCWVRNEERYLSVKGGTLTMCESLPNFSDKRFRFQRMMFHGREARTRNNTLCPPVFFCALQSVDTGRFITVQSQSRVGLSKSSAVFRRDITALRKPDCRFFKLRIGRENKYLLESLVYEGVYVTWNGRQLAMTKVKSSQLSDIYLIPPGLLFEIITSNNNSL